MPPSPSIESKPSKKESRRRKPRPKKTKLHKEQRSSTLSTPATDLSPRDPVNDDGIFFVDTSGMEVSGDFFKEMERIAEVHSHGGSEKTVPDYVGDESEVYGEEVQVTENVLRDDKDEDTEVQNLQDSGRGPHEGITAANANEIDGDNSSRSRSSSESSTITSLPALTKTQGHINNFSGDEEEQGGLLKEEVDKDLEADEEDDDETAREANRYFREDDPLQTCHRCGESGHSVRRCEHAQVSLNFRIILTLQICKATI